MDVTVVGLSRFDALEKVGGSTEVRADIGDEVATDEIRTDKRGRMVLHKLTRILGLLQRRGAMYLLAEGVHQFIVLRSLHGHLLKV